MIKILEYNTIRDKDDLVRLFIGQMPKNMILDEINLILKETRTNIPPGMRKFSKKILSKEVLLFISEIGIPDGYILSEELELKLNRLEVKLLQKQQILKKYETKTQKNSDNLI